jgi:hypothetical protein
MKSLLTSTNFWWVGKRWDRLKRIRTDSEISREMKMWLVRSLVLSIFLYGNVTWTLLEFERKRFDALKMWSWRRLLRVAWITRRTNVSTSNEVGNPKKLSSEWTRRLSRWYWGAFGWGKNRWSPRRGTLIDPLDGPRPQNNWKNIPRMCSLGARRCSRSDGLWSQYPCEECRGSMTMKQQMMEQRNVNQEFCWSWGSARVHGGRICKKQDISIRMISGSLFIYSCALYPSINFLLQSRELLFLHA